MSQYGKDWPSGRNQFDITEEDIVGGRDARKVIYVSDKKFLPELNKCYEVSFIEIINSSANRYVRSKLRIDGLNHTEWFDLEANKILDPELQKHDVYSYREIVE